MSKDRSRAERMENRRREQSRIRSERYGDDVDPHLRHEKPQKRRHLHDSDAVLQSVDFGWSK